MLSIIEICAITGRDRKTVTAHVRGGDRYRNAVQESVGRKAWSVPVQDLVDAGDLKPSQVVHVPAALEWVRESRAVAELRARIVELEKALEVQSARAEERLATVTTLQALLPALLPAPSTPLLPRVVAR